MKIGFIVDSNLWECPYVDIYTRIINTTLVSYDLIVWDRDLSEKTLSCRFSHRPSKNRWLKFFDYFEYSCYIKKIVSKNKYDKLIVFGQATGIFLLHFLKKYYKGKYILDYRDVGIDRIPIFKNRFISLVENSYCTVLSSPGFIKFLPKGNRYFISHNFNEDLAKTAIKFKNDGSWLPKTINVLTIGSIRDFETNSQILDALGNVEGYTLSFIGKGPKSDQIYEYSQKKGYRNVTFRGKYLKQEENSFVSKSSFINLFLPNYETHSTPMANRFYLALINRKPMIVSINSTQSAFVEKYNLGISIQNTDNLKYKLANWYENNSYNDFQQRCIELLKIFLCDQDNFKNIVNQFIIKSNNGK